MSGDGESASRACGHCAVISTTAGAFCPACGKSYTGRKRPSKKVRHIAYGALLIVILGTSAAAITMKKAHDRKIERQRRQAHVERVRTEALAARLAALKRQEADTKVKVEKLMRRTLESGLEKEIAKYARKLVTEGTLEGPILGASCTPASGGSSRDLSSSTGGYSCMAITRREAGGTSSGYRFSGNIDFVGDSYSWHLGAP